MARHEFLASGKAYAIRRAVDFWYRTLYGKISLLEFLSRCRWAANEDGVDKLVYDSDQPEIQ
jgi:hypothetical protein